MSDAYMRPQSTPPLVQIFQGIMYTNIALLQVEPKE